MHNDEHVHAMRQPSNLTLAISVVSIILAVSEVLISLKIVDAHGGQSWFQFMLDSFVESASSIIVFGMELRKKCRLTGEHDESRSAKAIAVSFFVLAVYGLIELFRGSHQLRTISVLDIGFSVWFALSTLGLYFWKVNHGKKTHNLALQSDAKQSRACVLSGLILLATLFLSRYWSLADILGQLAIAAIMFYEGHRVWQEKRLCC